MADGTTDAPAGSSAKFWLDQLSLADSEEKDWRQTADDTVERYRDERDDLVGRGTKVDVFAANVAILQPNIYSQSPVPDVRRRAIGEDPLTRQTGAQVAGLIEKALAYAVDDQPFDQIMEQIRDDMLLTGRGVGWLTYDADIERRTDVQRVDPPAPVELVPGLDGEPIAVQGPTPPPVYLLDGQPVEPDFDDKGMPFVEQKTDERVTVEHVFWADFRMSPARSWRDVWWCARRLPMTRGELKKEFGVRGLDVPLNLGAKEGESSGNATFDGQPSDPPSRLQRAEVWELWNKRKRERLWLVKGYPKVVRIDTDPLGLREFFPCPEPLYNGLRTTTTMVPLPEFMLYKDQADELDEVQSRIRHLERVLKAVVFVNGDFTEAIKIANATDGTAIPIERPSEMVGDLAQSVWSWPIERVVQVISELTRRTTELQNQIWQVTGLHDVQRGAGKERESAAAQKLKTSFGQVRMTPRSLPMARFARDVLRLAAEVMAELFDQSTLERIGGMPVTPEMMALLREEKVRNTSIAVATDATVRPDKQAEQEQAVEFMGVASQFLQQVAAVGQAQPAMVPLMLETFRQTARTFKWSRAVEPMIDATIQQVTQQSQALMQQQEMQVALQQQQMQAQQQQMAMEQQAATMGGGMMQ